MAQLPANPMRFYDSASQPNRSLPVAVDGVNLHEGWPVSTGGGGRPVRSPSRWERLRRWRWRWLVLAVLLIVAAAASVVLSLADAYRPLAFGEDSTTALAYPGLPAGHGIRTVNTFGGIREDIYIPPQRGTFYLFVSVMNAGSRSVIIENVSLPKESALTVAGPVRYARPGSGNGKLGVPPARRVLHNVGLAPGREILLAIPVRSWPCWTRAFPGFFTVPSFDVSYRFLFFHHVAALPWGMHNDMLIMHAPFGKPGKPGVFCVNR